MNARVRMLAAAVLGAVSVAALAADVVLRRESWSGGTAAGWEDVDTSGGIRVNSSGAPDGGALRGEYAPSDIPIPEPDGFVCSAAASGGLFSGDLTAGDCIPREVAFDCMAVGALPSFCCIRLGGTNAILFAPVTEQITATGVWQRVTTPLAYDPLVWHGGSGASFSNALRDAREFQIGLVRRGNETQALVVDNFTVVCEVSADTAAEDADGDGLPDYWESKWFGGATNGIAGEDSDGDGLSNADEHRVGTDPNDPESVLKLTGLQVANGRLLVRYVTVPERQYRVFVNERPLVDPASWTAMTAWAAGHGGYHTAVHSNAPAVSWYRLKAKRP